MNFKTKMSSILIQLGLFHELCKIVDVSSKKIISKLIYLPQDHTSFS